MGQPSPSSKISVAQSKVGNHWFWLLPLMGLLTLQGWLVLGLFDPEHQVARLFDDQPIVSGQHPLHLYHGFLGAHSLREHGTDLCFDPMFNAGYPKTPVFDSGCRPAEIMLLLDGGTYSPRAYKIGLAVVCAAIPWLLALAARGVGLTWAGTAVATALGIAIWWGQPCREALEAGDVALLLATALILAQAGMLIRYHKVPGPLSLLGVSVTGLLGWFTDPVLMALLLPLFLTYYLSVGSRHRLLWHIGLLVGLALTVALNAFWLLDYLQYWWVLLPLHVNAPPPLAECTFPSLLDSTIWGGPVDRTLTSVLLPTAVMGLVLCNQTRKRPTARFFGLAMFGFLALAVASLIWEPLGRFGMARLLVPGLCFAVLPATHFTMSSLDWLRRRIGWWVVPSLVTGAVFAVAIAYPDKVQSWSCSGITIQPLAIGLSAEQQTIVTTLREDTTAEARVLWEDLPASSQDSRWTALLPHLTGRACVGGLDPDGLIEHTATGLSDHVLAGRPLNEWTVPELQDYCQRYNIGWVVCWTPDSLKLFADRIPQAAGAAAGCGCWNLSRPPLAMKLATLHLNGREGTLLRLDRQPSFVLVGSAQWLRADTDCISLGDVMPKDGQVLLSLHYQEGLRVTPSRVQLERAEGLNDRIDFMRLVIPSDHLVSHVMITWDKR